MKLSPDTLDQLDPRVSVPQYDRSAVKPGILHIGVGNFHRAHQAVYLDRLLRQGGDTSWGIRGAGVRSTDEAMRERLGQQGWLSSVVEIDANGLSASVTGALVDFVPVAENHGPLIAAIAEPVTKIVSLTVTEGGYYVDPTSGTFSPKHPEIVHDAENPDAPVTVFGAILAGLRLRKAAGLPVTIMSCDNLPGNGNVTRDAIMGLDALQGGGLADWINAGNVTFPNGMVDRITPATSAREIERMKSEYGIEDASPVFCEPFIQWVLEDNFAAGRPDFESVGVTLTDQVHAYESMKIRVLNGGHAIIAYAGGLAGIEYVHDAMANTAIADYLTATEVQDVLPQVHPIGDMSPRDYLALIADRFGNPGVADTIRRLCLDGSNRQPKFILLSVADALAAGRVPHGLALTSAMWARYCLGKTDAGEEIAPNDPNWDALQTVARAAEANPAVWLDQADIYGDLNKNADFVDAFVAAYEAVRANGALKAISDYSASVTA